MSKEKLVKPIHLACSDDEMRPLLACVNIKNGYAIATNGHMIVKQLLKSTSLLNDDQIKKLEGKFIHRNVWAELVDCYELLVENDTIVCRNEAGKVIFEFAQHAMLFPDVETVLDKYSVNPTNQIGLNPKYIGTLSKIFDSTQLKFQFDSHKAALITNMQTENHIEMAYLMALSID